MTDRNGGADAGHLIPDPEKGKQHTCLKNIEYCLVIWMRHY